MVKARDSGRWRIEINNDPEVYERGSFLCALSRSRLLAVITQSLLFTFDALFNDQEVDWKRKKNKTIHLRPFRCCRTSDLKRSEAKAGKSPPRICKGIRVPVYAVFNEFISPFQPNNPETNDPPTTLWEINLRRKGNSFDPGYPLIFCSVHRFVLSFSKLN